MAIVTTYVCGVSGKTGTDNKEFIPVRILLDCSNVPGINYSKRSQEIKKLVHIDVAKKLHLISCETSEEATPKPTFESQLASLLRDYIDEIAYEAASEAIQDRS